MLERDVLGEGAGVDRIGWDVAPEPIGEPELVAPIPRLEPGRQAVVVGHPDGRGDLVERIAQPAEDADDHRVEQRGSEHDQIEDQGPEEFAKDNLGLADGRGHQRFNRSATELLAEQAHGDHGEEDDENHGQDVGQSAE